MSCGTRLRTEPIILNGKLERVPCDRIRAHQIPFSTDGDVEHLRQPTGTTTLSVVIDVTDDDDGYV